MFDVTVMITPSSIPMKFSAGRIVVTLCTLCDDFLILNMSDKQRFQRVVNQTDRLTGCATDAINLFIGPSQSNCLYSSYFWTGIVFTKSTATFTTTESTVWNDKTNARSQESNECLADTKQATDPLAQAQFRSPNRSSTPPYLSQTISSGQSNRTSQ